MELKDGIEGQTAFLALHSVQLSSSGVPEHFWEELYKKLKHGVSPVLIRIFKPVILISVVKVFDAGENFGLARIEQDEDDPLVDPFCLWKVMVTCPDGLKASDRRKY
jgi:tubulin--tyrosine ligase-like protein 12